MQELIVLYVTMPNEDKASEIIYNLLEKKLIACANIMPIKSIYNYENKINTDHETLVLLKTSQESIKSTVVEIEKLHPYKTPCILGLSATANSKYYEFVTDSVKQ